MQLTADVGSVSRQKIKYSFHHAEFHAKSEHARNGKLLPMEMQMYYRDLEKKNWIAVALQFAVPSNTTRDSAFLNSLGWDKLPKMTGGERKLKALDFTALKASLEGSHYVYKGSLSRPPCTQNVEWHVVNDVLDMSLKQYRAIAAVIGKSGNRRKVQSVNKRDVYENAIVSGLDLNDNDSNSTNAGQNVTLDQQASRQNKRELTILGPHPAELAADRAQEAAETAKDASERVKEALDENTKTMGKWKEFLNRQELEDLHKKELEALRLSQTKEMSVKRTEQKKKAKEAAKASNSGKKNSDKDKKAHEKLTGDAKKRLEQLDSKINDEEGTKKEGKESDKRREETAKKDEREAEAHRQKELQLIKDGLKAASKRAAEDLTKKAQLEQVKAAARKKQEASQKSLERINAEKKAEEGTKVAKFKEEGTKKEEEIKRGEKIRENQMKLVAEQTAKRERQIEKDELEAADTEQAAKIKKASEVVAKSEEADAIKAQAMQESAAKKNALAAAKAQADLLKAQESNTKAEAARIAKLAANKEQGEKDAKRAELQRELDNERKDEQTAKGKMGEAAQKKSFELQKRKETFAKEKEDFQKKVESEAETKKKAGEELDKRAVKAKAFAAQLAKEQAEHRTKKEEKTKSAEKLANSAKMEQDRKSEEKIKSDKQAEIDKRLREKLEAEKKEAEKKQADEAAAKKKEKEAQEKAAKDEQDAKAKTLEQTNKAQAERERQIKELAAQTAKEAADEADAKKKVEQAAKKAIADQKAAEQKVKDDKKKQEEAEKAKVKAEEDAKKAKIAAEKKAAEEKEKQHMGQKLTLGKEVEAYGHGYDIPLYAKHGQLCILSGVGFVKGKWFTREIATVPKECRPLSMVIFPLITGVENHVEARMSMAGKITTATGDNMEFADSFVTFSGLIYPVEGTEVRDLSPDRHWGRVGGMPDPVYFKTGDLCVFSGVIGWGSGYGNPILTLPSDCRPRDGHIRFNVNHHRHRAELYLNTNGHLYIHWTSPHTAKWFSLDGIAFMTESKSQPLEMASGYSHYGYGWRIPSYQKQGHLCVVAGLARGSIDGLVTILPSECRPHKTLVFWTGHYDRTLRIDVHPSGQLKFVSGKSRHGWISLDGISFVANHGKLTFDYDSGSDVGLTESTSIVLPAKNGWKPIVDYRPFTLSTIGSLCILSGSASNGNLRASMATLPANCRPSGRLIFPGSLTGPNMMRVDVIPDGNVVYAGGAYTGSFASITGFVWPSPKARTQQLKLLTVYVPYDKNYAQPSVYYEDGFCVVTGLLRRNNWAAFPGGEIAQLPPECIPEKYLMFHMNHHEKHLRIDINQRGTIVLGGGSGRHTWLSLSGMSYFAKPGNNVKALWGWHTRSGGHRQTNYRVKGDLCSLSGLLNGNGANHMFNLPDECRPKERLSINLNHHLYAARIEIFPDGRVMYAEGSRRWGWVSFDGCNFITDYKAPEPMPAYKFTAAKSFAVTDKQFTSGNKPYGDGYLPPSVSTISKMVFVGGLDRTNNINGQYFKMPDELTPSKEHTFASVPANNWHFALRARPDGYIGGNHGSSGVWSHLSPIKYPLKDAITMPLHLNHEWMNFPSNSGKAEAAYIKVGDFCMLQGWVMLLRNGWNHDVGYLPEACRPTDGHLIFATNAGHYAQRIDLHVNGRIYWVTGNTGSRWLSLSGIGFFTTSTMNNLDMHNGWRRYTNGQKSHRQPCWRKEGNLCVVSGLAYGNGGNPVAVLPQSCWPKGRLIFMVNHHQYQQRVDILPNGQIHYVSGSSRGHGWLSLDGLMYVVDTFHKPVPPPHVGYKPTEGTMLKLLNGFAPHHEDGDLYRPPMYTLLYDKSVCILSGVAKASSAQARLTVLPEACRPDAHLRFSQTTHNLFKGMDTLRIDVEENGDVAYGGGNSAHGVMPIEGIMFAVKDKIALTELAMYNYMVNVGGDAPKAGYYKVGGLCMIQGLIRHKNEYSKPINGYFSNLPKECQPVDGHLIFNGNAGPHTQRMNIISGKLHYDGAPAPEAGAQTSLNEMIYFPGKGRPLTFLNGYSAYGYGYRAPSIQREKNLCLLSGLMRGNNRNVMSFLPNDCHPKERLRFTLNNNQYLVRIDILPDGRMTWASGINHNWVSLDGIRYVVPPIRDEKTPLSDDGKMSQLDLKLLNGFIPYKRGYVEPIVHKWGDLCMVSGLARDGEMRGKYAQLPSNCLPTGKLAFDMHYSGTANGLRIDMTEDGVIQYNQGVVAPNWVSFDGMLYPSKGTHLGNLPLMYWFNYNHGFAPAQWMKQGKFCVLSGMVTPYKGHDTTFKSLIARTTTSCRPAGRLIFNMNHGKYTFRVDVRTDGYIEYVTTKAVAYPFMSFSGTHFMVGTGTAASFVSGWGNYNNGFEHVTWTVQGGLCNLQGLANGNGRAELLNLPAECRPAKRLIFSLNHHYEVHRYDIFPSGLVVKIEGTRRWGWISVSGVAFAVAK